MNELEKRLKNIRPRLSDEEHVTIWTNITFVLPSRAPIFRKRKMAVASGIVLFTLFSSGIVTVSASTQSLPGDRLFPTKLALERVQVALTQSEEKKTELRVKFANERLEEVRAIARSRGMEIDEHEGDGDEDDITATSTTTLTGTITVTQGQDDPAIDDQGTTTAGSSIFEDTEIDDHMGRVLHDLRDSKDATSDIESRKKIEHVERTIIRFRESPNSRRGRKESVRVEQRDDRSSHGSNDRKSDDRRGQEKRIEQEQEAIPATTQDGKLPVSSESLEATVIVPVMEDRGMQILPGDDLGGVSTGATSSIELDEHIDITDHEDGERHDGSH